MRSVLVVDDNPDYRLLVRLALSSDGLFDVVGEAARGADGVDLAGSLQPDVALVDLVLAGEDGLEVLSRVRRAAPSAAVIGVSAFPESDLRGLPHPGSVGYLSKAVRPSRLGAELALLTGVLGAVEAARSTVLAADTSSARAARRFVDDVLSTWEVDDLLETVQLLVSEVVTNAVVHGRSEAEVSVRLLPDRVRVEVVDRGPTPVRRRDADDEATSGRGTALVEALSSAWGIEDVAVGKMVWFEVARPG